MRTLLVLVPILLIAPVEVLAQARPTHASLRKAWEQNAPSLVTVKHRQRSGPGVIAGAGGQVITSVEQTGLEQAKILVDGEELDARVVAANAQLKIVVLQIEAPDRTRWPSTAVHEASLVRGSWLVGARSGNGKGAPSPLAGRVLKATTATSPFLLTDLSLPPGSPLFDTRGRLVAVVVERAGRIGSLALPISAIRRELAREQAAP